MPAVQLAKSGTSPGEIIVSPAAPSGNANFIGNLVSDVFVIKVQRWRTRAWSPIIETTGDGDSHPVHENNQLLYFRFFLLGVMVAADSTGIGIDALAGQHTTTQTVPFPATMQMNYASGITRTSEVIIEDIQDSWERTSQVIGLTMSGYGTDTAPGDVVGA